jgi:PAS domain S-box-containing protein
MAMRGEMAMPDLLGSTLGQYRVEERLGSGGVGVVYRATQKPTEQQVALKVLDPGLTARPGFMRRFVSQAATISKLGHPGIVPVYEIGTRAQLTYLSMRLVHGGTLRDLLVEGTVDLGSVWRILRSIADALHSAHEAGVVHQDLKPSNVLLEGDGSIMLTDFGLARINYGYALGTPGYMSPEQAMGLEVDRRSDVHALGLLAFELLTGTLPFAASSPVDLILATVYDPVPSARALNPDLPPELESVLFRALAKSPADRQSSVFALLEELSQVPMSRKQAPARGPALITGSNGGAVAAKPAGSESWGANLQLLTLFEASLDAVVAIDETGLITHWNSQAETMLGWSRQQIMGLPALTTFIAPRYREVLERIFATFLAVHEGPQEGQAVEVVAIHRDGHQIPLELSLSLVQLQPGKWNLVAFCRDISARKDAERLRAMQDAAADVLAESDDPHQLFPRLLQAVCGNLDWPAGAIWMLEPGGRELRCREFWQAASLDSPQLASLSRKTTYERGAGVPGQVCESQEPVWHSDLVRVAESARELAALRAGLQAVGAFPIHDGSKVLGVLEVFSATAGELTTTRFSKVESVARRLGRQLGRAMPRRPQAGPEAAQVEATLQTAPVAVVARQQVRYRIDARHSRLGFSCAFMKFLTVHGHFNDFGGWVELDNDDPKTARAECVVKTSSVDTGSLDRDYHLCSKEFFSVESYPDMVFTSTGVERRGDERFRLIGDLTIRNTTRPIRLDVRLEERETDSSGNERATLTASTVISRLDWFLDWQEALEAGRWIVGEQIKLDLELALVHRPEGPGA